MTSRRRLVQVPATSANLGPGFDVMAAALSSFLELEVTETGEFGVACDGLDVSKGRDNLVVRAFEKLHPADGVHFRIGADIPLSRGLGSSAAAIVAGLVAADHLYELGHDRAELLAIAAGLEGHPDNVAAALHGGFVVCGSGGEAVRIEAPGDLEALVVVPNDPVSTDEARAAIPAEIPTADAVANISAAAMLVSGLYNSDLGQIAAGLRDRMHQPRRRHLFPRSMELVEAAPVLGAIGATVSGAGPSVLVWTTWEQTGVVAAELERRATGWADVIRMPFCPHGARIPEM